MTKKSKLENYDKLQRDFDLLQRYFWDTQANKRPDKVERYKDRNGTTKVELWQCGASHGGYVIITEGSSPQIHLLEDVVNLYRDNHSEYTAGIRICLERVQAYRNAYYRMHQASQSA